MKELTDGERMKLIEKAFLDCEQEYTQEDLLSQFRREKGREPHGEHWTDRRVAGEEAGSESTLSA